MNTRQAAENRHPSMYRDKRLFIRRIPSSAISSVMKGRETGIAPGIRSSRDPDPGIRYRDFLARMLKTGQGLERPFSSIGQLKLMWLTTFWVDLLAPNRRPKPTE